MKIAAYPPVGRMQNVVFLVIRLFLGGLFLWSSLVKLRQPYMFLESVYQYELLGPKSGMFVAMLLPWAELFLSLLLLGEVLLPGSMLAALCLGAIFTFANASVLWRGLSIGCGCFGKSNPNQIVDYMVVGRSFLIMLAAAVSWLLLMTQTKRGTNSHGEHI